MNTKKQLLSLLGGFIVMFLLSGLWYMLLMKGFYAGYAFPHMLSEPILWKIAIGYLILAWLMVYIYPIGYKGGSPMWEGLKFGVIIGLLWVLPNAVVLAGVYNYHLTELVVDSAWHVVEQGIGGLVIGMIYGNWQATTSTSDQSSTTPT